MDRAKNRKILMVLILGIVLAVITGVALFFYMRPQKTTIYVFADSYSAGTSVTEDMLLPMQVDSTIVVAGASTDTSTQFVTSNERKTILEASANVLRMDVAKNMPLTKSMLSSSGGTQIENALDSSKVAVTVPVDSTSGVTNDLTSGSRVNIYANGYSTTTGEYGITLLFEDMRILAVTKDKSGNLQSATVEVSVSESMKLINAETTSTLYFALVNGAGYQESGELGNIYIPSEDSSNDYTGAAAEGPVDSDVGTEQAVTEEQVDAEEQATEEQTAEEQG